MRRTYIHWILRVTAVVSCIALAVGCDTSLEPFAKETGLYSIYGYLTVGGEQNYVRVKNLNDPVLDNSAEPLDATVTLTNLKSGTTETLADSMVAFDGRFTHNFRTRQDIRPGVRYRVRVEGPNGNSSETTATTPEITETTLSPQENVGCNRAVVVGFPEIPEPRFIDISLGIKYGGKLEWLRPEIQRRNMSGRGVTYGFKPSYVVWRLLPHVVPFVRCEPERYCNVLDDRDLRIAYTHFGPDWPADSLLVDPLASEVKNGVGVFGGLRRDTMSASLDADLRCLGAETLPCNPIPPPPPPPGCPISPGVTSSSSS